MRRQKRDMNERAWQKGYHAGFSGRNKESCPHQQEQSRFEWLKGWREGREDHWNGFNEQAALQRQVAH